MAAETTIVRHTLIVDASCDYGRRVVGVGIVVREARRPGRRGPVVDQLCEAYRGVPPGLAEMFAVLRALEISAERGVRIVKVRSDYNYMRRQLKDAHKRGEGRDRSHRSQHGLQRPRIPAAGSMDLPALVPDSAQAKFPSHPDAGRERERSVRHA